MERGSTIVAAESRTNAVHVPCLRPVCHLFSHRQMPQQPPATADEWVNQLTKAQLQVACAVCMCITWLLTMSGCGACWNLASSGRRLSPFMPCAPHAVLLLLCFPAAVLQVVKLLRHSTATHLGKCLLWSCLGDVAHPNLQRNNAAQAQVSSIDGAAYASQDSYSPSQAYSR